MAVGQAKSKAGKDKLYNSSRPFGEVSGIFLVVKTYFKAYFEFEQMISSKLSLFIQF